MVDGNKDCISHTEAQRNPWIKVEFAEPIGIDEVKIWNRSGFEHRFDGAQVAFFDGERNLATVEVRTAGNLSTFANNYGLPRR